jgi:DNA repair protein RadC
MSFCTAIANQDTSEEDIKMTKEIKRAAQALSIVLHDHIIIGKGQWLSFRKMSYL